MDRKINIIQSLFRWTILLVLFTIAQFVSAQNCTNFDRKCATPNDKKFEKSSMSRSVKIRAKQKQAINITLFEGKEYYISVCGKSNLGNIQMKIISGFDKKVIYDNAANGFTDFITIKSELTQKLIFEISAPTGKFDGNEHECVGVLIASHKLNDSLSAKKQ